MLQQTTVNQVVPYFHRFMRAFPTLNSLAHATEQDVLRVWEGLGYYRRARDLHAASKLIVLNHGGRVPLDPDLLGQLPGMGRYTRNAVLSQAFDLRLPVVEANSQRVLCRLFGQTGHPSDSAVREWLWMVSEALLPHRQVGDFNQALMELGALVCTPARPHCGDCPLSNQCRTFHNGLQKEIPPAPRRPTIERVREAAGLIYRNRRVLLVQRPSRGRWANMWEFPHGPIQKSEESDDALIRLARELCGLKVEVQQEMSVLKHAVTRFRITVACFEATCSSGRFRSAFYQSAKWLRPNEVPNYPVSVPYRRLAKTLVSPSRQRRLF
jgi:A/G-specific adenine glycosylase